MEVASIMKGAYDHFMQKEIHEQPESLAQTLMGRIKPKKARSIQSPRSVSGYNNSGSASDSECSDSGMSSNSDSPNNLLGTKVCAHRMLCKCPGCSMLTVMVAASRPPRLLCAFTAAVRCLLLTPGLCTSATGAEVEKALEPAGGCGCTIFLTWVLPHKTGGRPLCAPLSECRRWTRSRGRCGWGA